MSSLTLEIMQQLSLTIPCQKCRFLPTAEVCSHGNVVIWTLATGICTWREGEQMEPKFEVLIRLLSRDFWPAALHSHGTYMYMDMQLLGMDS